MTVKKVLIADDNVVFAGLLKQRLDQELLFDVLNPVHDGKAALEAIGYLHPDVVVLDMVMPKVDGLEVLERIRETRPKPVVVVFSAMGGEGIISGAATAGADAYFLKPFDLDIFVTRLKRLAGGEDAQEGLSKNSLPSEVKNVLIAEVLHRMMVPPHVKGYAYMKMAIAMVLEDPSQISAMTKVIYPEIARAFGTRPPLVERSMRHAVELAWNRCDPQIIEELFGYTVDAEKGKPSNREFVAMLADRIKLAMQGNNRS